MVGVGVPPPSLSKACCSEGKFGNLIAVVVPKINGLLPFPCTYKYFLPTRYTLLKDPVLPTFPFY